MKIIDVTSPEGNVFCILGHAQSFNKQLKESLGQSNPIIDDVLTNYFNMEYDEILNKLESTTLFRFVNRKKQKA